MTKRTLTLLATLCLFPPAFARAKDKSAKKQAADEAEVSLPAPQVLEKNDVLFGARVNTGSAFGGNAIFGLAGEWMFSDNFGGILEVNHDSYTVDFGSGSTISQFKYTVWAVTAMATFHADFLKATNFDPFVSVGLGRSFYKATWDTTVGTPQPFAADSGGFFVAAYVNARYFINSSWAVMAQLGTGLGTFGFGVDYVF